MNYVALEVKGHKKAVMILEALQKETEFHWHSLLVVCVLGFRPNFESLKQFIKHNWRLCGVVEIATKPNGFFLSNFASAEEC